MCRPSGSAATGSAESLLGKAVLVTATAIFPRRNHPAMALGTSRAMIRFKVVPLGGCEGFVINASGQALPRLLASVRSSLADNYD